MPAPFKFITSNVEGDEIEVSIRTENVVCPECNGEGKSSAHLGAFSGEDLDNDPEFAEAYFAGAYDRQCGACKGKRVIAQPTESLNTPENWKLYMDYCEDEAVYQSMVRSERAMGA